MKKPKRTKVIPLHGCIVAVDFKQTRRGWLMEPPRPASESELCRADIPALLAGEGCWLADRTPEAGAFRRKHNIPSMIWP